MSDKYKLQKAADAWHKCSPESRRAVITEIQKTVAYWAMDENERAIAALIALAEAAIPEGSR